MVCILQIVAVWARCWQNLNQDLPRTQQSAWMDRYPILCMSEEVLDAQNSRGS